MKESKNRRQFLKSTATLAAGLIAAPGIIGMPAIITNRKGSSLINGVQIGVITYSFRSMEDQSAEATLQYIVDSGISAIELMGEPAEAFAGAPQSQIDRRKYFTLMRANRDGELTEDQQKEWDELQAQSKAFSQAVANWRSSVSMDAFKKMKKMYQDAGVSIYGFKPHAFGKDNTDAEINYGFKAAKALGASHVTLEHPGDDEHTAKLGKMASKHGINVAYHGHEQQTPTLWDTALQQSKHNMLNIDIGHYVAAGNDMPLKIVEDKHDRISSMHLKDRQTPAHGKGNLVWGEGDTPIREVLQLMRDQKYAFPGSIELEYQIPEGSDAVKEVRKCLEYCKQALA